MKNIEKQIKIAEWLGWELGKCDVSGKDILFDPINFKGYGTKSLKFDKDSNWQWLCLEKIAKECDLTIWHILGFGYFKSFNSKQDLFEAIFNYIENANIQKI